MGFFDSIKDKLGYSGGHDDYYEDDGYDDDYSDTPHPRSQRATSPEDTGRASLLGNPERPKAESISVYTRSGELVDSNYEGTDAGAPAPYRRNSSVTDDSSWTDSRLDYSIAGETPSYPAPQRTTPAPVSVDPGLTSVSRINSGNLPAYVLRPVSYDDVQMVMRRVRTNQPVVLDFKSTSIEAAKRILDFCFGLTCGIGGTVQGLDDRVFVVLPAGVELSQQELGKLVRDGVIKG